MTSDCDFVNGHQKKISAVCTNLECEFRSKFKVSWNLIHMFWVFTVKLRLESNRIHRRHTPILLSEFTYLHCPFLFCFASSIIQSRRGVSASTQSHENILHLLGGQAGCYSYFKDWIRLCQKNVCTQEWKRLEILVKRYNEMLKPNWMTELESVCVPSWLL